MYSFPKEDTLDDAVRLQHRFQYDYNAFTPSDRMQFMYFRGLTLNLISWLNSRFIISAPSIDTDFISVEFLAGTFLAQHASAVLNYKIRAFRLHQGFPNCTPTDIICQLNLLFENGILGQDPSIFNDEDLGASFSFGVNPSLYTIGVSKDADTFMGGFSFFTLLGKIFILCFVFRAGSNQSRHHQRWYPVSWRK